MSVGNPLRVAYLCRYLPSPSETFVLDEALALSGLGAEPVVFVLDRVAGAVRPARHGGLYKAGEVVPRPSSPRAIYSAMLAEELPAFAPARAHWMQHGRMRDLRRVAWLARQLRRRRIDVIRVHHAAEIARFAVAAGAMAGVPVSVAVHARDLFVPVDDLQWILQWSAHVSTITKLHRDRLLRMGLPSHLVDVIPCGVAVPEASALPPEPGEPLRVISVGRLVRKKGHDLTLAAAAQAVRRGVATTVTILGEGEGRLELARQSAALIAEVGPALDIELQGAVPVEEVERQLAQGRYHVAVLPCRICADGDRDGVPVALMEALAHGVPVITTDLPGFDTELNPDDGAHRLPLVHVDGERQCEVDALTDAMLECLHRPFLRQEQARRARAWAEARRTPESLAGQLLEALRDACDNVRAPVGGPP